MLKHILKRLLISVPILIGVVLLIFIMLRIIPGNPVTTMLGEHVNERVIEKITREWGLDEPLYVQFFKYVGGVLRGDFGTSYKLNRNVTAIILEAFPTTLRLSLSAAFFAWLTGVTAGIFSAIHKDRLTDRLFMGLSLFDVSMPVFMIALWRT